jgi:hypothetical protein
MPWSATTAIFWSSGSGACGIIARSAFNSLARAAHMLFTANRYYRQGVWGNTVMCTAVSRGSTAMSVSFSGQAGARPVLKRLGKDATTSYQFEGRERPGRDLPTG